MRVTVTSTTGRRTSDRRSSLCAAASATSTTALDVTAQNGAVQKVGYYHRYGGYFNYGYGYQYCKHLYYKGWVLDYRWAQIKYLRHCRYKYRY